MILIDDSKGGIVSIEGRIIRCKDVHHRVVGIKGDGVAERLEKFLVRVDGSCKGARLEECDLCLLLRVGCEVYFGTIFTVSDEVIEGERCHQRCLSLLTAHLDVGLAITTAVGTFPIKAYDVGDDPLLPGEEDERLPGKLSTAMTHAADKRDTAVNDLTAEGKVRPAEVIDKALTSLANVETRLNFSRKDVFRILHVWCSLRQSNGYLAPLMNFSSGDSSAAASIFPRFLRARAVRPYSFMILRA